jgi:hypothetical protein
MPPVSHTPSWGGACLNKETTLPLLISYLTRCVRQTDRQTETERQTDRPVRIIIRRNSFFFFLKQNIFAAVIL